MKLRVMDVFSGIGGFSLGLKRAGGFRTVAYCEIDPYCQRVLQARMFDGSLDSAPLCTDIRSLDGGPWAGCVDLVCGGFPCQDISDVGKRAGIEGERSGLWKEIARLVREIRPRFVLVENVSALLVRGMGTVLGDLAAIGYDAEWEVISAAAVGAPHLRERVWIVAYPEGMQRAPVFRLQQDGVLQEDVAYAGRVGLEGAVQPGDGPEARRGVVQGGEAPGAGIPHRREQWRVEPEMDRVAHGVPQRVDRLSSLGNAVVPQVVEWIGRRIMKVSSADSSKGDRQ